MIHVETRPSVNLNLQILYKWQNENFERINNSQILIFVDKAPLKDSNCLQSR